MDSRCIKELVHELDFLLGSRVDRIGQPGPDEIHIAFRKERNIHRLGISLRKDLPRAHVTTHHGNYLKKAPALTMALRRHLEGARLTGTHCPDWERYFTLTFSARNRLGDPIQLDMIVELIPRASNLTVVDASSRILTSWAKQPGGSYTPPPEQTGVIPHELQTHQLHLDGERPAWKPILEALRGFSPLLAKEAVYQSGLPVHTPAQEARPASSRLVHAVHELARTPCQPAVYYDRDGQPRLWHVIELRHLPHLESQEYPSAHQAAEAFYSQYLAQQRLANRTRRMRQLINTQLKRTAKKLQKQQADWERSEDAGDYKLWGELLYAQSPQSQAGARDVQVVNYYTTEQEPLTIPLDPTLSVRENARRYFEKYNKAVRTKKKARRAMRETKAQLDYLHSLKDSLEAADSASEISEIWEEMQGEGLLRQDSPTSSPKRRRSAFSGLTFTSPGKQPILLGKNHRQNERLVRMARPDDIWLHARGIPGAHVLVRSPSPPPEDWPDEDTLLMAAQLAAYYSKAAGAKRVDVDWTWAKHVRKPKQGKPGMVIYDGEQTLRVTPRPYEPNPPPE